MSDKYPVIHCPICDVDIGILKHGKMYRGSNPTWDNYCPFCLKNLTKVIGDLILELKNKKE